MNLIIDIGNTRAKLLAMEDGSPIDETTSDSETLSALPDFTRRHSFSTGIVSTVANVGNAASKTLAQLRFPLLWFRPGTPLPFPTTFPPTMGSDRIAAVVGAMTLMPATPLLVVDAGTCITYEFLDNCGRYLGGNIAPGLTMRLRAMHEHTSRLPLLDMAAVVDTEELGADTTSAMIAGVLTGARHELEGYIRYFRGLFPSMQVVLTGGDASRFFNEPMDFVHTDPYLVPRGLDCILKHNSEITKQANPKR